ncbi:hypothetical protein, partial [Bacillus thuringiensis]|uniref:hypothetical protein n=1 Tax=Bacillus thuringiensis TaxID=1428 RepID=UPI001C92CA89
LTGYRRLKWGTSFRGSLKDKWATAKTKTRTKKRTSSETETWTTYEEWHKKIPPLWNDIIGYATKVLGDIDIYGEIKKSSKVNPQS